MIKIIASLALILTIYALGAEAQSKSRAAWAYWSDNPASAECVKYRFKATSNCQVFKEPGAAGAEVSHYDCSMPDCELNPTFCHAGQYQDDPVIVFLSQSECEFKRAQ